MIKKDSLLIAVDYTHNTFSCHNHKGDLFPSIINPLTILESSGKFEKNEEEILDFFDTDSKVEILRIISNKQLNLLQIKKILGHSYGTLHSHIKKMKDLGIVESKDGISERGRAEKILLLSEGVQLKELSECQEELKSVLEEQINNSKVYKISFDKELKEAIEKTATEKTSRVSSRKKD